MRIKNISFIQCEQQKLLQFLQRNVKIYCIAGTTTCYNTRCGKRNVNTNDGTTDRTNNIRMSVTGGDFA